MSKRTHLQNYQLYERIVNEAGMCKLKAYVLDRMAADVSIIKVRDSKIAFVVTQLFPHQYANSIIKLELNSAECVCKCR